MQRLTKGQKIFRWFAILVVVYAVISNPSSRQKIDEVTDGMSDAVTTVQEEATPLILDVLPSEPVIKDDKDIIRLGDNEADQQTQTAPAQISFDDNSRIGKAIKNYVLPRIEQNIRRDLVNKGVIGEYAVLPSEFKVISNKKVPGSFIALCGSKVKLHYRITDSNGKIYIDTQHDKQMPVEFVLGDDASNVVPKAVELVTLGMSEKGNKVVRVAKDLLEHPDIVIASIIKDKKAEGEDVSSDSEVPQDTHNRLHASYILTVELVSIDASYRRARAEFLRAFAVTHSMQEVLACGDPVVMEYELFRTTGASMSSSRYHGTVNFNIGDEIIPHTLERAFYGGKYDEKRVAIIPNNLTNEIEKSKFHMLKFFTYAKEPYYIEFKMKKPSSSNEQ